MTQDVHEDIESIFTVPFRGFFIVALVASCRMPCWKSRRLLNYSIVRDRSLQARFIIHLVKAKTALLAAFANQFCLRLNKYTTSSSIPTQELCFITFSVGILAPQSHFLSA